MKTKLIAMVLMAGSTMFAGVRFGVGVNFGVPVSSYRVEVNRPPYPGSGYVWVDGYNNGYGSWVNGYWAAPPYAGSYWVAPSYVGGYYGAGYWGGERRYDRAVPYVNRDNLRFNRNDRRFDSGRGFRR